MSGRLMYDSSLVLALAWMTTTLPGVASAAHGQQAATPVAATITGTITDQASQQPIPGVQVTISGTGIGSLTDESGKYTLNGVSAGNVTVRARRIGYVGQARSVTVEEGRSTTVDFVLTATATSLDAIVVTGTPGGAQLRTLGNAISRMDVAGVAETSPAANVGQLIGQRSPGVMVLPSSGMVGTGSSVRIRGAASLSLSNQPIIYVDGIRVDNNASAGPDIRQGRQAARLDDFNPEDIESMEIISGPAAATLYGTEASNGVIQIITKRGKEGKTRFDLTIKEGANYLPDPSGMLGYNYGTNPVTGELDSLNMIEHYKEVTGKDIFSTGRLHQLNASVSGGSSSVRYFVSADRVDNTGILPYNWEHSLGTRANLDFTPAERWQVGVSSSWTQSETRFGQAADQFGVWDNVVWASPKLLDTPTGGFKYNNPDVAASVDSRSKVNRFTGGLQIRHSPTSWLAQQLKIGADVGQTANQILFPRLPDGVVNFYGSKAGGDKTLENLTTTYNTVDYAITATTEIHGISAATSVGAQYYRKQINEYTEHGANFPISDVTTIGGAASTTAGEDFIENKTLGGYVQEALGWNDRVFVTAAIRADANSAFGEDFDAAYYPKLSGAWVLSEAPFWRWNKVNTLRLRAAWGQAGQQPDVFDAVTLFTPTTGPGGVPTLTPASLGNTALKPERGSELEVGFDFGLFGDRVTGTFTHYNRTTSDAIVRAPVQPSGGFPGVRVVNLGTVKAWGNEIGLKGRVLDGHTATWDVAVNYATAHNRIEDLGGIPPIRLGTDQEERVGYPVASIFWYRVLHAEFDDSGALVNVLCDAGDGAHTQVSCDDAPRLYYGQTTPTWMGSISNTVTLFGALRLMALVDFQGGMMYENGDIQAAHQNFLTTYQANSPVKDPIFAAYQTVVPRAPLGLYDAGFAKLRELSASYTLPDRLVEHIGGSKASITAAWRNVATIWRAQSSIYGTHIPDSEMHNPGSELTARYQTLIPPSSQVVLSARVSF